MTHIFFISCVCWSHSLSLQGVACYWQVEAAPNSAPMLAVARNLRMERDREEQIQKQKQEQRNLVSHTELCLKNSFFVGFW